MTKPPRRLTIVPAHNSQKVLGNPLLRKNPSRPVIVAFGNRGSWSNSDRFYLDLAPVALPPAFWGAIVHGATAPPHRPRGDPEDQAGQLVLVAERGEGPSLIASHAPGAFDEIRKSRAGRPGIQRLDDRRLPGSGIIQNDRSREPSLPRLAHRSDLPPLRRRDPRPRPLPRHPHAVQPDLLLGQLPIVRPPASPGRRRALASPLRRGDRRPAAGPPSSLRLGLARGRRRCGGGFRGARLSTHPQLGPDRLGRHPPLALTGG